MQQQINGIQQIGVGVTDIYKAFNWYKKYFGFNVVVFEDKAAATLMTRYTGGNIFERHAALVMNMQGGGGLEIWQYSNRPAVPVAFTPTLGDTGVFAIKLRCNNINAAFNFYKNERLHLLTRPAKNFNNQLHFYMRDAFSNIFEIVEDEYCFTQKNNFTGGVCGALIGVSNMDAAVYFYKHVLGYSKVLGNEETVFADWQGLPGSHNKIKRVLLQHKQPFTGAFSKLLGTTFIELVQNTQQQPRKLFANRYWGDAGFIHICFDVTGMAAQEKICNDALAPFTVNSNSSFDMGEAAGHFAYNEDPDGTLIEYVETHRVPVVKKMGWYINLKQKKQKALPDWVVKCMGLGKKKLQL
jgi:catechol 2,3-dioxygenase-like lactoylglutathione lyase family enzyme